MVAAAAGLPDLVPVPLVRGAVSGDLGHAPTADGVDDTCVIMAVIRVVTSGECSCFRCLASLDRLDGRSPRVLVRPAPAWLLLPSSAADTGGSAAAGLDPKRLKINMSKVRFEVENWRVWSSNMHAELVSIPDQCWLRMPFTPRLRCFWRFMVAKDSRSPVSFVPDHTMYNCTRPGPGCFWRIAASKRQAGTGHTAGVSSSP